MDTYRITQILQDLVNEENSRLSKLNELLQEAINNPGNGYNTGDYQVLEDRNQQLSDRNAHLENEINGLRGDYERIVAELANNEANNSVRTNAEIDALRALADSLRSDRDNLQNTINSNGSYVFDLQSQLTEKQNGLDYTNGVISELQAQVAELNSKVSELLADVAAKQLKIDELTDTTDEVKAALSVAKDKIKEELEEAMSEIDQSLDEIK
jgi:chromosome segregation ATPase